MKAEFHFDFGSPNAYLCHRLIPGIEQRTGATFEYVPILLGGIFKLTGNQSPVQAYAGVRNKMEYQRLEMQRFLARHAITDFQWNPHFPINTLMLMRGAAALQPTGEFKRYVDEMFRHMWVEPKKLDDPDVLRVVLSDAGFDVDALFAQVQQPAAKDRLMRNTNDSVERGAFGAPTFFVNGEMYFGKDRLAEVEEALTRVS